MPPPRSPRPHVIPAEKRWPPIRRRAERPNEPVPIGFRQECTGNRCGSSADAISTRQRVAPAGSFRSGGVGNAMGSPGSRLMVRCGDELREGWRLRTRAELAPDPPPRRKRTTRLPAFPATLPSWSAAPPEPSAPAWPAQTSPDSSEQLETQRKARYKQGKTGQGLGSHRGSLSTRWRPITSYQRFLWRRVGEDTPGCPCGGLAMPDWSYQTLLKPLLFLLPPETARDLSLETIGALGRSRIGAAVIDFLGHMRADPRLETVRSRPGFSHGRRPRCGPGPDGRRHARPGAIRCGISRARPGDRRADHRAGDDHPRPRAGGDHPA